MIYEKELTSFDKEMVQVGAVASVILEDSVKAETNGNYIMSTLGLMRLERLRQLDKWGEQHQTLPVWMVILMEEVGEAADELDADSIEDVDLRNLIQSIGSLGAGCKAYLEMKFGM